MKPPISVQSSLRAEALRFYRDVISTLKEADIPFLVGGAFAFERYTGIARHTKDLDIFILREHAREILAMFAARGYRTEMTNPEWIGKAFCESDYTDFIFNSANGIAEVDAEWFEHAIDDVILGIPIQIAPIEEIIWSKAFIMERERYDGADIAHLLYTHGPDLDWPRLMRRFGDHWRVLLSYLVLFGYIYPSKHGSIPDWVMQKLVQRLQNERLEPLCGDQVCRGTLLSDKQYAIDIEEWGHQDGRIDTLYPFVAPREAA